MVGLICVFCLYGQSAYISRNEAGAKCVAVAWISDDFQEIYFYLGTADDYAGQFGHSTGLLDADRAGIERVYCLEQFGAQGFDVVTVLHVFLFVG